MILLRPHIVGNGLSSRVDRSQGVTPVYGSLPESVDRDVADKLDSLLTEGRKQGTEHSRANIE